MRALPRLGMAATFAATLAACDTPWGSGTDSPDPDAAIDTGLRAAPETLSFRGTSRATIELDAGGSWTASASADWLTVEPTTGSGDSTITVTVDREGLAINSYTGAISIAGAGNSTTVWVLMRFPEVHGAVETSAAIRTGLLSQQPANDDERAPGSIIVRLDPQMVALDAYGRADRPADEPALERAVARLGAQVGATDFTMLSPALGLAKLAVPVEAAPAALAALEADGRTLYAERDAILRPSSVDDPHYPVQWHYPLLDLESAWDITAGSDTATVAVVDADFHPDHPDLQGALLPGWNFADDTDDLLILNEHCQAHATHVAGTVAAATSNAEGVAGIAPGVRVLPLNVAHGPGAQSECDLAASEIARAILYAAGAEDAAAGQLDRPVDVINLSIGGGTASQAMEDALDYAHRAGVVTVVAAGNTGRSVQFPARLPRTIAVSATDQFSDVASYSSTGPEITVAAPGGDLVQTLEDYEGPGDAPRAGVLSTGFAYDSLPAEVIYDTAADGSDHAYLLHQGTSMAAPHVAGVVALMRSANSELPPNVIARILEETAVDLGPEGRDDDYGHGLVNAAAAVAAAEQYVVRPEEDLHVRLLAGGDVVAETYTDRSGGFRLTGVPAGEYVLEAGAADSPSGVFGATDVSVTYDGDVEVTVPVSAN